MASLRSSIYHEHLGRHFSFRLFVCCWEVQHYATINQIAYVRFGVTPLAMHHLLDDHCTCRGIISTQGTIITCQSFPSTPINALITLIFFNYWHLVDMGTGYWVLVTEYCILGLDTEYWVLSTGHWVVGIFAVKSKVSLLKDRVPLITLWFFKHSKIQPFTIFTIGKVTFGLESLFKKITSCAKLRPAWASYLLTLEKLAYAERDNTQLLFLREGIIKMTILFDILILVCCPKLGQQLFDRRLKSMLGHQNKIKDIKTPTFPLQNLKST